MDSTMKGPGWVNALLKVDEAWSKVQLVVVTIVFCIMLVFMMVQVVFRFSIKTPIPWSEELIRYTWIALAFIGSAVAVQKHEHIEIDVLSSILKKVRGGVKKQRTEKILNLFRGCLMLLYCLVMSYMCFHFTLKVYAIGQLTPALLIPKWWIDAVICFGWMSMSVHCVFLILKTLFVRPAGEGGGNL